MANKEKVLQRMEQDFYKKFCPFGYADVERALEVMYDIDMTEDDLLEEIDEYVEDVDSEISSVDVVALAYEKIYRETEELLNQYNIDVDLSDYVEVMGNFLATSFDGDIEELIDKINEELDKQQKEELCESKVFQAFMDLNGYGSREIFKEEE